MLNSRIGRTGRSSEGLFETEALRPLRQASGSTLRKSSCRNASREVRTVTRCGEEGALMNVQMSAPDDARYHLNFTVQALNLTNHANYTGFIGTLTSPFFGKPTTVNNMRKIEFLVNFQF